VKTLKLIALIALTVSSICHIYFLSTYRRERQAIIARIPPPAPPTIITIINPKTSVSIEPCGKNIIYLEIDERNMKKENFPILFIGNIFSCTSDLAAKP
jgi:hypothetical protein